MLESYVQRWAREQKEQQKAQEREAAKQMADKATPERKEVKDDGTNAGSEGQEAPAE